MGRIEEDCQPSISCSEWSKTAWYKHKYGWQGAAIIIKVAHAAYEGPEFFTIFSHEEPLCLSPVSLYFCLCLYFSFSLFLTVCMSILVSIFFLLNLLMLYSPMSLFPIFVLVLSLFIVLSSSLVCCMDRWPRSWRISWRITISWAQRQWSLCFSWMLSDM